MFNIKSKKSPVMLMLYGFIIVCIAYSSTYWESSKTKSSQNSLFFEENELDNFFPARETGEKYKTTKLKKSKKSKVTKDDGAEKMTKLEPKKIFKNTESEIRLDVSILKPEKNCHSMWISKELDVAVYEGPQYSSDTIHDKNFTKPITVVKPSYPNPKKKLDPDRFFAPILTGGPNNQIYCFRDSLLMAIKMNRTIVIPKFFKHFTDSQADSRGQSYIYPGHRINVGDVCKYASCITLDKFKTACGNKVDAITHIINYDWIHTFNTENNIGMRVSEKHPKLEHAIDNLSYVPEEKINGKIEIANIPTQFQSPLRCLIHPRSFSNLNIRKVYRSEDPNIRRDADLIEEIIRHTGHPEYIQKIAEDFINWSMNGREFLSVHWRYNEGDYLMRCRNDLKNGEKEGKNPQNDRRLKFCLDAINTKADDIAQKIETKISSLKPKINIEHIYVASPYNIRNSVAEVAEILKNKKGWDTVSSSDLEAYMDARFKRCPTIKEHLNDILSTTEMEICGRGTVYLSSARSTWSENVKITRRSSNNAKIFTDKDDNIF